MIYTISYNQTDTIWTYDSVTSSWVSSSVSEPGPVIGPFDVPTDGGPDDIEWYNYVDPGDIATGVVLGGEFLGGGFTVYGAAQDVTVENDGSLSIDGGSATGTVVNALGACEVESGGVANTTTVNGTDVSFGYLYVESGGVAIGTTLNSWGYEEVESGGSAFNTTVNAGAASLGEVGFEVDSGGVANGTTVNSGGVELVHSGGSAYNTTVASGGSLWLDAGFIADSTTISAATAVGIASGLALDGYTIKSGAHWGVDDGGSVSGTIVDGGFSVDLGAGLSVESGGVASATTVNSGGVEYVYSGGSDFATTIETGGTEYVFSGGSTSNATIDGGYLELSAGSVASGAITFESTGGTLDIGGTTMPTAAISGFAAGDTIDLTAISANSYTYNPSTEVLTLYQSGSSTPVASLNIVGDYGANSFALSPPGFGRTDITVSAGVTTPTISIADAPTVYETPSGTADVVFTVTLSAASQDTIAVGYATQDGTADAGTDYQAESGTLTFAPGQTTATISVPIIGTELEEHDETFSVVLSNPTDSGGGTPTISGSPATGTIDALFTEGDDTVDFNNLTSAQQAAIAAGSDFYHGLGGDDVVTLPSEADYNESVGGGKTLGWTDTAASTFYTGSQEGDDYTVDGSDGSYYIVEGAGAENITITGDGSSTITAGSGSDSININGDGDNTISAGPGNLTASISGGGTLEIDGNFVGSATIGANSTLQLDGAASGGTITFDPSGTNETLVIDGDTMPTDVISGFVPGDTIDLAGVPFNSSGYTLFDTNNKLHVGYGGSPYILNFSPSIAGGFALTPDSTDSTDAGTDVELVSGGVAGGDSIGEDVTDETPPVVTGYSTSQVSPYTGVLYIRNETSGMYGTGFVIGPHTILTCAHVVSPPPSSLPSYVLNLGNLFSSNFTGEIYSNDSGSDSPIISGTFATALNWSYVFLGAQIQNDLAIIQLPNSINLTPQNGYGQFVLSGGNGGGTVNVTGFPESYQISNTGSTTQFNDIGTVTLTTGLSGTYFTPGTAVSNPGESGSPLWLYNGSTVEAVGIVQSNVDIQLTSTDVTQILGWTNSLSIISTGQVASGLSVANGDTLDVLGEADSAIINSGGVENVYGVDTGATINDGGYQYVLSGGVATDAVVNDPGTQVVASGGTVSGTVINGGLLDLQAGAIAAGSIDFASGTGGALQIDGATMPTAVISGFGPGDTIDLTGVSFSAGVTASLEAGSGASGSTLAVGAGGSADDLNLAEAPSHFSSESVSIGSDGNGGTDIFLVPAAPTLSDASVVNGYVNAANDTAGQTLGGTAEAGSTVNVYLNGSTSAAFTTTANGSGDWSVTLGVLANGSYSYTATATDAAGNTSAPSSAYSFTVDTTPPPQPAITAAALSSGAWKLTGSAVAGSTVTVYDGATKLGAATANSSGVWSLLTDENNSAIRDFFVTLTDAAGNTSASAAWLEGTPGADVFQFASAAALAAPAGIFGNGGLDTIELTAPATLVDADFAHVHEILTLALSGASTVTLGADAAAAEIANVRTGNGATSITDNNAALVVNAAALGAGNLLTLAGPAADGVIGLTGNLSATGDSGALGVVTGATAALSIAAGTGLSVIDASAMTSGETLTLTGAHNAALTVGGNLSAGADAGALTVIATGTAPHMIQTGSGAASITATHGGDTIDPGTGADMINVSGHRLADSFVYRAVGDSPNTPSGHDTITGFAAGTGAGAINDILNFSAILGPTYSVEPLSSASAKVNSDSIAWIYNASARDTLVYVNATGGALSQTSNQLMEVALVGNVHLAAANLIG